MSETVSPDVSPGGGLSSLAALLTPVVITRFLAPDDQKENFGSESCKAMFLRRLSHLAAQLGDGRPWLLEEDFTAADISVGYALRLARLLKIGEFEPLITDYYARLKARPAFQRADAV